MAITTYDELKVAITSFPERDDLSEDELEMMISLAEARLNRLLNMVETEADLTGTAESRLISISALKVIEPISLKMIQTSGDEKEIILSPYGSMNLIDDVGEPTYYEISGTNIRFDRELDDDYEFRFVYSGRFALSDAAPTNKLLTENPDIYLAASIVWGGIYTQDETSVALKGLLDEFIAETRKQLAQFKRTRMTQQPMIAALGRRHVSTYTGTE